MASFDISNYQTAQERLDIFWTLYPSGRISNDVVLATETEVVVRSSVWTDRNQVAPTTVDYAQEPVIKEDKIRQYVAQTQPLSVTIKTAETYNAILFDDRIPGSHYIYPQNHYINSVPVTTTLTYTGQTYYHYITGTSHTITPDDWQTTYQLWKGL